MKKLSDSLANLRLGKPALMTHVVLGYPTLEKSIELIKAMSESGVSVIEIQIPFSDPIADGPTIMSANQVALENGITPKDCFEAVEKLKVTIDTPLLFMSYFNILLNYKNGVSDFCKDASACGIQGLIVPDVPPEETTDGYWSSAKEFNLSAIPIVSPVSSKERLELIKKTTDAEFVYCVSVTGTTGARTTLPTELADYLSSVRNVFKRPLALGFGISSKEQVTEASKHAELCVVGSAVIDIIRNNDPKNQTKAVTTFLAELFS